MDWNPPRGYKGLRTNYRHAVDVDLRPLHYNANAWQAYRSGYYERIEWCEENCKKNWSTVDGRFWFDSTKEAIMFKMVFGGR